MTNVHELENRPQQQGSSSRNGSFNLWQRLVEPSVVITDANQRRQASLVSAILLVLVLATSSGTVANTLVLHTLSLGGILGGAAIFLGITYVLSRTRHYRVAPSLLLVALSAICVLDALLGNDYSAASLLNVLIFNILLVLLSSTLASFRTTIFLAVANFLFLLVLPILIPTILYTSMVIPLLFNGITSALVLVLTQHRNLMEKGRLLEVSQINRTLETSNADLNARTRDLNLAAEVGNAMSEKAGNLFDLLTEAAELIRSRFDLYYTQVYLVDPSGRTLSLRAGTGEAGKALLQRGHRLPVGSNSLNGRAVFEAKPVVVADTAMSPSFLPNPLLPNTRSEMAIPLIAGGRALGVLDVQSEIPGALNQNVLAAFEVLAGQLAIAIQNATLFAQSEEARAEVEAQARRLTQAGWREFLDAVNRSERLGYAFDLQALTPLTEPLSTASSPDALDVPILVTGESIGHFRLERDADTDRPWDPADSDLVSIVASRVANQVENLRLLAQAQQYRAEAETAMRRLTREGWDTLQTRGELALGYVYNLNEVRPLLEKSDNASDGTLKRALVVRDEPIGELAVDVEANFEDAAEIIAAVAEQLSGHIESLRLSVQMEQALATTQKQAQREQALRQITSAVRSSNDPATIMRTAVRELGNVLGRKTVIRMATVEQVEAAAGNGDTSDSPADSSPISAVGGKA